MERYGIHCGNQTFGMFVAVEESIQIAVYPGVIRPVLRVRQSWDGRMRVYCVEHELVYVRPAWHLAGVYPE